MICRPTFLFIALFLAGFLPTWAAESSPSKSSLPLAVDTVTEGPRIPDFDKRLKQIFPDSTQVREISLLPEKSGGSSFMGLVHRLLGERVNRSEGLKTRRYIYVAQKDHETLGVAHASTIELGSETMTVTLFYDPAGQIRMIDVEGIPGNALEDLNKGGYLSQFVGKDSHDFEVVLGRRGRIRSRGPFLTQSRKPSSKTLRSYFDKILRSVRFNTAFMEIAYFISQHPEELDSAPTTTSRSE